MLLSDNVFEKALPFPDFENVINPKNFSPKNYFPYPWHFYHFLS